MTQAIPETEMQAPFLVVTADLGGGPELRAVGVYLDSLGVLGEYALGLASLAEIMTRPPDQEPPPRVREILFKSIHAVSDQAGEQPWVELSNHDETLGQIVVDRLRLASPLEAVLAAVAQDVKPLGYALAAMGLLKTGLNMIMDWQRHRAEIHQMERAAMSSIYVEELPDDDSPERERARQALRDGLVTDVILQLHRETGIPAGDGRDLEISNYLAQAIKRIASVPLTAVQSERDPRSPGRAD